MGHFQESTDGVVGRHGETVTCCHCNGHFEVRDNEGLFIAPTMCAQEHKPLCVKCAREANAAPPGPCAAFERWLAKVEGRDRFLRSAGIL